MTNWVNQILDELDRAESNRRITRPALIAGFEEIVEELGMRIYALKDDERRQES